MTFATQSQVAGREIVRIVELVLPRCVLRYGNAPCTAGARAQAHPNLVQQSEVFSGGWSNDQAPVFSSYIAPNSTLTGVLLVDSHNAATNKATWQVNSGDPVFAALSASAWLNASVHLLKKSGSEPSFALRVQGFDGIGSSDFRLVLDGLTGCWSAGEVNGYGGSPIGPKVVDCGSWWRLGFGFNRAGCNSLAISYNPAWRAAGNLTLTPDTTQVGSAGVWGAALAVNTAALSPYVTRGVESQWISTGFAGACYNTSQTCVVLSAYLAGDQSLFFIDEKVDAPRNMDAFAALVSADLTPTRLNPQMGVAQSARLSVDLRDFSYDDTATDPYADARSYTPNSQGTFFGRFLARDPYVQGKKIRYYEGYYAGSGTFTFSHYLMREFIVDEIDRPDSRGRVRIRGTDILRLTNGDRSLCPVPCTATIQGNITAVDTKIFLPTSSDASFLANDMHIRIEDELLFLVTQVGCSWTTSRAVGMTTAAVHSKGCVVQLCQTYSYMNVCSIMMDLIVNKASIPSSYIAVASWDAEKSQTLTTYNLYNIISQPTAVRDLLSDVARACDLGVWYDETLQKIVMKHQSPWTYPAIALSDSAHFIEDTVSIKARDDLKVSRVGISYGPTDYADASDFGRYQLAVNSLREDSRFDGRKSEYNIETAWLSASHDQLATTIAGRTLFRYSDSAPLEAQFKIDATIANSLRTGDVVELNTRMLQGVDGLPAPTRMQLIESGPDFAGHSYRYSALLYKGLSAASSLSIDVSTWNYNVHSAMGGPTAAVRVYLTVNSGIYVGGSGPGQAAITTSGLPAGSVVYLTLLGSSMVLGYAGWYGRGADGFSDTDAGGGYSFTFLQQVEAGSAGGDALYVAPGCVAYIDVSAGYLFAGGPGGGGGGLRYNNGPNWTSGGSGGLGQGFTNSAGPNTPQTAGVLDGGQGGVWGGTATAGEDGNPPSGRLGGAAGEQGRAVRLGDASATYYFIGGYDSTHVKGLVGL